MQSVLKVSTPNISCRDDKECSSLLYKNPVAHKSNAERIKTFGNSEVGKWSMNREIAVVKKSAMEAPWKNSKTNRRETSLPSDSRTNNNCNIDWRKFKKRVR